MKQAAPDHILNALIGLAVGDALGVPVEFTSRERLRNSPVTDMIGWGTHDQQSGTWSDDSSMAFCLAKSLCTGYELNDIAAQFVRWYKEGIWTPHGIVFDIGIATSNALHRVESGVNPLISGGSSEFDNGNGSLMRILPLIFYLKLMSIQERYRIVAEVSGITHAHIRSVFACFFYCEYALKLLEGVDKYAAFQATQRSVNAFLDEYPLLDESERNRFHRVLGRAVGNFNIQLLQESTEEEIASSGYVLHTLEASIWCLLMTNSYSEAVLKAVNLGQDTDTTGCVTGGLAGLYYGLDTIPQAWINLLARKQDIFNLAGYLSAKYN